MLLMKVCTRSPRVSIVIDTSETPADSDSLNFLIYFSSIQKKNVLPPGQCFHVFSISFENRTCQEPISLEAFKPYIPTCSLISICRDLIIKCNTVRVGVCCSVRTHKRP